MKFLKILPVLFVAFTLVAAPIAKADHTPEHKAEVAKMDAAKAGSGDVKTDGDTKEKKECEKCKKGHECKDCKKGHECKDCKDKKKKCEHCEKNKEGCEHCKVEGASAQHEAHGHAKHPHDVHEEEARK